MADPTGFKVLLRPKDGQVDLVLTKAGDDVSQLALDPKDVAVLAGHVLAGAAEIFAASGKAAPYQDEPLTLSAVSSSGWNILPGDQPGSLFLVFHFGEANLSIRVPRSDAQSFAQRLLLVASQAPTRQH